MNRALAIPEILDAILVELDDNRNDLRSIALARRSFCGPAMARIWFEHAFSQNKTLLPQGLADTLETEQPELSRILFYTSKIRRLSVEAIPESLAGDAFREHEVKVQSDLSLISRLQALGCIPFQNLKELHIMVDTVRFFQVIMTSLVAPSLERFNLILIPFEFQDHDHHDQALADALVRFSHQMPSLRSFSLVTLLSSSACVLSAMREVLLTNSLLEEFDTILPVDQCFLHELGKLPRLRKLSLPRRESTWNGTDNADPIPARELPLFESLNDLHVGSVRRFSQFRSLRLPNLRRLTLDVEFTRDFAQEDFVALTIVISTLCPILHAVKLNFRVADATVGHHRQSIEVVYGFFKCKVLREFCVRCHDGDLMIHVGDSHIEAMSSAWPFLEILDLNTSPAMSLSDPLTAAALVSLARNCTNITEIKLPHWSTKHIPSVTGMAPSGGRVVLYVYDFDVRSDAVELGEFLSSLWSQLEIRVPNLNGADNRVHVGKRQYRELKSFWSCVQEVASDKVGRS